MPRHQLGNAPHHGSIKSIPCQNAPRQKQYLYLPCLSQAGNAPIGNAPRHCPSGKCTLKLAEVDDVAIPQNTIYTLELAEVDAAVEARKKPPVEEMNGFREEDRFRDSPEILDKFFKFLFVIIALKTTSMGAVLFESHPIVTNAMVLMTVLFYLLWLLGVTTLLSQRIGTLPTRAFRHFMLVVGSICSVLILSTISTLIAWLTAMLWIIFLTVTGYFCYRELYEWAAHAISDTINRWIHSYTQSGRRLPV